MKKPWTVDSLLRHLRRLLVNPQVHLQFKPLSPYESAKVEWDSTHPPKNIRIKVDDDKEGRIRCVIHELLHVVMDDLFSKVVSDDLEESAILAWENMLHDHVMQSSRRIMSWRKAIEAKLIQQEEDEDG